MSRAFIAPAVARALARERVRERLSYSELARRHPAYGRTSIAKAVRAVQGPSSFELRCAWCEQPFTAKRPDARVCSGWCYGKKYDFDHNLTTSVRPPRPRACAVCGADISHKRAEARYCSNACGQRAYRSERR